MKIMKMKKRQLWQTARIATLIFIALLVLLAGCGTGTKKEEGTAGTTSGEPAQASYFPLKEQIKVKVMQHSFDRGRDTIVDKEVEKRTNIKFEWDLISGSDLSQKLDVVLSAGDIPDMMILDNARTRLTQYAPTGMFADLSPYLPKMKNYQKMRQKVPGLYENIVTDDGKLYGVPCIDTSPYMFEAWVYRKDIWQKQGWDYPKTLDELRDQLKQLKQIYPDSLPISVRWKLDRLVSPFFMAYHTWGGYMDPIQIDETDNTYKLGATMDNWRRAVSYVSKLYKDGLVDPEFPTLANDQFKERVLAGKVFMFANEYLDAIDEFNQEARKANPATTIEFEAAPPPKTENGLQAQVDWTDGVNDYWVVVINSKSKYIEQLAMFLDWQMSEEGLELLNWGIKGETYTEENGVKKFMPGIRTLENPDGTTLPKDVGVDGRCGMWAPWSLEYRMAMYMGPYAKAGLKLYIQNPDWLMRKGPSLQFTAEEQELISNTMAAVNTYISENTMSFVLGKTNIDSDAEWEKFQQGLKALNYEKVVQLYNEKYNKLPENKKKIRYAKDYLK